MKTTRVRDCERKLLLLDMLRNRYDHPSALTCAKDMRKLVPSIGNSTIYRHLSELVHDELIVEQHPHKGPARYDAAQHDHAHFFCLQCKNLIDVEEVIVTAVWPGSTQTTNCIAKGICSNCLKTKKSK